MKRAHVRKLRDKKAGPAGRRRFAGQDFGLFGWAIKNDLATVNPAEKLEKLGGGTEGFYTWTEEDVEAFEKCWPVGTRPRLAMAIMLYLGVRRSDAVVIGRKHESQDGQMVLSACSRAVRRSANADAADLAASCAQFSMRASLGVKPGWRPTSASLTAMPVSATSSRIGARKPGCRNAIATACARLARSALPKPGQASMS